MPLRRTPLDVAAAALLLSAAVTMPGCAVACPAIAYSSAVSIDTDLVPGVTAVQICVEDECTTPPGEEPDLTSLLGVSREDDGTWTAMLDMRTPDELLIRLYDADGVLLREYDEPIAWTFTGGACPGPATADPVVLA